MKKVLIVGAGKGGTALIHIIHSTTTMKIVAVIDHNDDAPGLALANKLQIQTGSDWRAWVDKSIDIIIEATGDQTVLEELIRSRREQTVVVPGSVAYIISELVDEKDVLLEQIKQQSDDQELILNHIRDGMIVIDKEENIQFVNEKAAEIVGHPKDAFIGKHIRHIIKNSRLPNILQTKEKEINQKFPLENGKQIISTRIPLISENGDLIGAFTVFKDITEVVKLAEENTDLIELKNMLEAIIKSSDAAISVVDEHGNGIMINPAYTRITGLTEDDVIGKPATVDIHEGESMHMKVLQTGNAYRGVRMKVGQKKSEVIVNVAPVIAKGKIQGSVGVLHDVSEIQALTNELEHARRIIRSLEAKYTFDDIIGSSPEMQLALEQAKVGAKTPATVLLRGDSGTGKELFAHAIHNESDRKQNKFIRVNCATMNESLLEMELFGYESRESPKSKVGAFEAADEGSVFLDEIGELSLDMQSKLLRVLEEKEIIRVGGKQALPIDVRIITATNTNLEKAISNRTFREDLYYRLNRLPIFIPSLSERVSDIRELAEHLILKLNEDYRRDVKHISEEAIEVLEQYQWPGNVRELENMIGRAMIYMDNQEEVIKKEYLPKLLQSSSTLKQSNLMFPEWDSLTDAVDGFEKDYIYKVYKNNGFNKTKTAQALNISIRNLYYKIEKYQLE
ncbi:sigma 54-interacting transcriptional regulator [Oceanobacillus alkalisoli]|uniref:sigma 54-interacting transcriptional regulator n=1 Tax=Oceanobacillus alkalisoli TaxID=2925113 RepID=UPI001EF04417|nr:sigma 54-interacting transcriptional regulator [Oceanobacillus alkalisoli]MCF3941718.1 sigma 54-interacting transcriptional regulator [Oceanobacillus alkalisoli]MCG5102999.1 sigma 54-interacting transcriptional regulator [Oceanobacillus alkalisoli]